MTRPMNMSRNRLGEHVVVTVDVRLIGDTVIRELLSAEIRDLRFVGWNFYSHKWGRYYIIKIGHSNLFPRSATQQRRRKYMKIFKGLKKEVTTRTGWILVLATAFAVVILLSVVRVMFGIDLNPLNHIFG